MSKKAHYSAISKLKNPIFLVIFVFLALYTISVIFPLAWGFITTFRAQTDFNSEGLFSLPKMEYWEKNKTFYEKYVSVGNQAGISKFENYTHVFGNYAKTLGAMKTENEAYSTWMSGFVNQHQVTTGDGKAYLPEILFNTLLYTVGASILRTLGPMIVGYLCAMYRNKFSSLVHAFVIFVMVTPIVGGTAPMLALVRGLGIFDSWFDTFIRAFGFANLYFLVFYAFFESASGSYAEAAEIDGASQFRVMVTIYFPLAMTMFGTVLLMQFVGAWNDYNTPLMYMPSHYTLAYVIYIQTSPGGDASTGGNTPMRIATSMILAIPTLLLFVIFKKKLMGNLSLGGVKE